MRRRAPNARVCWTSGAAVSQSLRRRRRSRRLVCPTRSPGSVGSPYVEQDAPLATAIYRLYHILELWDWFASTGQTAPLSGIAEELKRLIALNP